MRRITEIFVHCSATRPEWMAGKPVEAKRDAIRNWHVKGNGWSDIGYHKVIDRDGSLADGRAFERTGAHARGHNANSIGICLLGGFGSASTDDFHDNFTPKQEEALIEMLNDLLKQFPGAKVRGHNEVAAKACPGFNVAAWWAYDRQKPLDYVAPEQPVAKLPWWRRLFMRRT